MQTSIIRLGIEKELGDSGVSMVIMQEISQAGHISASNLHRVVWEASISRFEFTCGLSLSIEPRGAASSPIGGQYMIPTASKGPIAR